PSPACNALTAARPNVPAPQLPIIVRRAPHTFHTGTAMTPHVQIALTVNEEATDVAFAPYKTLLEVLREDLNLCGTKHGCELGECGACAVILDDQPVLACRVLGLECSERRVTTVEGLATDGRLHPLQQTSAGLGPAQSGSG